MTASETRRLERTRSTLARARMEKTAKTVKRYPTGGMIMRTMATIPKVRTQMKQKSVQGRRTMIMKRRAIHAFWSPTMVQHERSEGSSSKLVVSPSSPRRRSMS